MDIVKSYDLRGCGRCGRKRVEPEQPAKEQDQ